MTMSTATAERRETETVQVRTVDCDVHLTPTSPSEIIELMPEPYRSQMARRRRKGGEREAYGAYWNSRRLDSFGPSGNPPGSDPEMVYKQLLVEAGVDLAMILPSARMLVDPVLNAEISKAYNIWLSETWLSKWNLDGRFFGSTVVSLATPAAALRELQAWGPAPRFKQLIVGHHSDRPFGYPQYEPIWEAAARHNLPVAVHFTGHGAQALGGSPVGRFIRYVEYHSVAFPLNYSGHLISLLCSGVFDRHPNLRFVLVEGGFLWHRPFMARLAHDWKLLRGEIPAAAADPMDYVRNNIRFTTQPIEESDSPRDVARLLQLAEADKTLMFSSDYPHFDYDEPSRTLPRGLDDHTRSRVMAENARELYDLPAVRPRTANDVDRSE